MIPLSDRIVYKDSDGYWKVLWKGKFVKQTFKTSGDASQHLEALRAKKLEPEY